mmetsp:Transcript_22941/g.64054  ORF Transcript_22941/g.64054 Transcript_22941/m.64054 type:complete len:145 (+) Transcript_22941:116-550(+)
MGCRSSSAAKGAYDPQDVIQEDARPNASVSRELPLIPETGHTNGWPVAMTVENDVMSMSSSRLGSLASVTTPTSLPASHIDSVAASSNWVEVDKESLYAHSFSGNMMFSEEDAKSSPEIRLESQNYLLDLDRMVQDDMTGTGKK